MFERLLQNGEPHRDALGTRYARSLWDRGDTKRATEILDRYVSSPGPPSAVVLRGLIEFRQGRMHEAIALLRGANPKELNERFIVVYHLAMAHEQLNQKTESQAFFDQLRRLERADMLNKDANFRPEDIDLRIRAARELLAVGVPDEAVKLLRSIQNQPAMRIPDNAKLLTECYEALGRSDPVVPTIPVIKR